MTDMEFFQDSGDSLEDFWESTSTYLSDDFSDGPLPEDRLTKGCEKGKLCVIVLKVIEVNTYIYIYFLYTCICMCIYIYTLYESMYIYIGM